MNRSRYLLTDPALESGEHRHGDSNPGTNPTGRVLFRVLDGVRDGLGREAA